MQKYAGFELVKGFYQALNNQITYKGKVVPVFDAYALPETQGKPYITIEIPSSTDNNTKTSFGANSQVWVRVVTGYPNAVPGAQECHEITDLVRRRLTGAEPGMPANLTVNGHAVYLLRSQVVNLADKFPGEFIIQDIIQFNVDTTQT